MWKYTSTEELVHGFKYIKKIKTGKGWRYFYTPSEIKAFYANEKVKADSEYAKKQDASISKYLDAKSRYRSELYGPHNNMLRVYGSSDVKQHRISAHERVNRVNKLDAESEDRYKKAKETFKKDTAKNVAERKYKPIVNTAKKVAEKPVNEFKKDATSTANKAKKTLKREVAGAKRAADIWTDRKVKRGQKVAMYYPIYKDKYYSEETVNSTRTDKKTGRQFYTTDQKKRKKKKTTRLERASLRAYRKTHPYE